MDSRPIINLDTSFVSVRGFFVTEAAQEGVVHTLLNSRIALIYYVQIMFSADDKLTDTVKPLRKSIIDGVATQLATPAV